MIRMLRMFTNEFEQRRPAREIAPCGPGWLKSPLRRLVAIHALALLFVAFLSAFLCPAVSKAQTSPPALGEFDVVVENDLFVPERKKPEETAESTEDAAAAEDELNELYRVYGTLRVDSVYHAYIKPIPQKGKRPRIRGRGTPAKKADNEMQSVTVGDQIDGWTVIDITDKGLEVELDGETVKLDIFEGDKEERKAIGPVAVQTPQPEVEEQPVVRQPAPGKTATPGKAVTPGKPASQGVVPAPGARKGLAAGQNGAAPGAEGQQAPTGATPSEPADDSGQKAPIVLEPGTTNPAVNPFLELLKRAKEQ